MLGKLKFAGAKNVNFTRRDFIFFLWLAFFVYAFAVLSASLFHKTLGFSEDETMLFSTGIMQVSAIIAMFLFARFSDGKPDFNFFGNWCDSILKGIVGFFYFLPIFFLIAYGWDYLFKKFGIEIESQNVVEMMKNLDGIALKVLAWFCACILAPIGEEMLFRGIIYRWLKKYFGVFVAAILISVLFALIHANVFASLPIFFLGLFFVFIYEYTGDIKAPIIAHFLFNFLNFIILIMR